MTEERVWLGSYPEGVPADIDASQYESLLALMADSFAKYAKRTAYSFMGQDISYQETDVKSQALAAVASADVIIKIKQIKINL